MNEIEKAHGMAAARSSAAPFIPVARLESWPSSWALSPPRMTRNSVLLFKGV